MTTKPSKIEGTEEAWDENGPLGNDFAHVKPLKDSDDAQIDESLGLQAISIRLQKSLIEDMKAIASVRRMGYQPLVRHVLKLFVECEKKQLLRERAAEMEERVRKEKLAQAHNEPAKRKVAVA